MRYSAFISYNHRDRDWAVWLHRALERYRVPKGLWERPAPWGQIGARLPPVFRDRDELATSSDLAGSVKAALAEAATLIVICSPNSAKSKWVNEEIKTFIGQGRAEFIRLIIVDGEPHSSDPNLECLPPALSVQGAPEPLAADVRQTGDGKTSAILKVLAGMLAVPYDELRRRETARRQKRLLVLATASSIGFLTMAALTTFALISRSEAVRQRQVAMQRTITAERTLDFVKGMFQVADPSEARGASITAREIVDRAALNLDRSLNDEPTVKAELGVTLSEVYGALGLYQKSDALVRRTFRIPQREPATRSRQLVVFAESQMRLSDYEAAAANFRRAWKHSEITTPALRSRILVGLGQSYSAIDELDNADRVLREAIKIDKARGLSALADLARDFEALGQNQLYAGQPDTAEALVVRALKLREKIEGPLSPSVSDNLNSLGQIAYQRGDLSKAANYFRRNVAVDEKVLGRDHPDVATTLNNLARILLEQRRFAEAGPLLRRAVAIALKERGAEHDDMAFFFSNLAITSRHQGDLRKAEELFKQAIAVARDHEHRTLGPSLADLADVHCASGRAGDGLKLIPEAIRVTREDYPDDPWRTAWVQNIRGECLARAGQAREGMAAVKASMPAILARWPRGTLFESEARRRLRSISPTRRPTSTY